HYYGAGAEILRQSHGDITHFIAGVGTGGTLTGIAKRLKEYDPRIRVVQAMPDDFPGIEGLKPLRSPEAIRPKNFDESLVDEVVDVSIDEAADFCRVLAQIGRASWRERGERMTVAARS